MKTSRRVMRGLATVAAIGGIWNVGSTSTFGQGVGKSAIAVKKERISGVIVKLEAVTKGAASSEEKAAAGKAATHRITINSNAVWRDWARDQAQMVDKGTAKKDAKAGENSVATRGEPIDPNSLVVIDLVPATSIETRYRAADDETSKGSKTQAGAGSDSKKAVTFQKSELKPGLFVEVDFEHVSASNPASTVSVIRPIGGPDSPAK